MKNVVLIGVGGIGFRHFQAILNCKEMFELFVVDINSEALKKCSDYEQSLGGDSAINVHYLEDVSDVPEHVHLAIIATSSLVRRNLFESLLNGRKVDKVIFEKFMFPRLEDYRVVWELLEKNNIRAHVDCPARMYDVYHQIKQESQGCKYFNAYMKGSNWGLACNSIHFADVVAYMSGADTNLVSCNGLLEEDIVDSKREHYIEFYGKIVGNIGSECTFIIECDNKDNAVEYEFVTDKAYYYVDEVSGVFTKISKDGLNNCVTNSITIPYVSQLTNINVDSLLRDEEIDLVTFEESKPIHESLLKMFLAHMNKVNGTDTDICPIT